nr:BTB/POZ domain protein [Pandoravirus massiliensis]
MAPLCVRHMPCVMNGKKNPDAARDHVIRWRLSARWPMARSCFVMSVLEQREKRHKPSLYALVGRGERQRPFGKKLPAQRALLRRWPYALMSKRKKDQMEGGPLDDSDAFVSQEAPINALSVMPHNSGASREAPRLDNNISEDEVINLDVRGTRLRVLRSTLATGPPDSLLSRLFGTDKGPWTRRPQADGSYFIDDDPKDFDAILCYLRYGVEGVRFESAARAWRARALAAYYMLDDMAYACLIQALTADLNAAPPHALATARYTFESHQTLVAKPASGPFAHYNDECLGVVSRQHHATTTTTHYVREWPLIHLLTWLARIVGVPLDGLGFDGAQCTASSWTSSSPTLLGDGLAIDVKAGAGRPLPSFAWTRLEHGCLVIRERGSTEESKDTRALSAKAAGSGHGAPPPLVFSW